jgi:hypothetical protein
VPVILFACGFLLFLVGAIGWTGNRTEIFREQQAEVLGSRES